MAMFNSYFDITRGYHSTVLCLDCFKICDDPQWSPRLKLWPWRPGQASVASMKEELGNVFATEVDGEDIWPLHVFSGFFRCFSWVFTCFYYALFSWKMCFFCFWSMMRFFWHDETNHSMGIAWMYHAETGKSWGYNGCCMFPCNQELDSAKSWPKDWTPRW